VIDASSAPFRECKARCLSDAVAGIAGHSDASKRLIQVSTSLRRERHQILATQLIRAIPSQTDGGSSWHGARPDVAGMRWGNRRNPHEHAPTGQGDRAVDQRAYRLSEIDLLRGLVLLVMALITCATSCWSRRRRTR